MSPVVYWIGRIDSPFAAALEDRLSEKSWALGRLDIEAPLRGDAVTVEPRAVIWQGRSLLEASAVVLETPVVAWPQPDLVTTTDRPLEEIQIAAMQEREARSLLVSSLAATSELVPVLNPLEAMGLVGAPVAALDRLASDGVPVHPWRLDVKASVEGALRRDVISRHLWHVPATPPQGEPARRLEPFEDGVLDVLVLGHRIAGAERYASAQAWQSGESDGVLDPESASRSCVAQTAEKAAWATGLPIVALALRESGAVLDIDPSPDLAAWESRLPGQPSAILVGYLLERIAEDPLVRF
ncbi:MAG: hypothetical protein RL885_07390 [Planctomycetota bacterium]